VVDDVVVVPAAPKVLAMTQEDFLPTIDECLDVVAGDPVGQPRDNISRTATVISHIDTLSSHGQLPCRCCHLPY
jgi:hypothetical protein